MVCINASRRCLMRTNTTMSSDRKNPDGSANTTKARSVAVCTSTLGWTSQSRHTKEKHGHCKKVQNSFWVMSAIILYSNDRCLSDVGRDGIVRSSVVKESLWCFTFILTPFRKEDTGGALMALHQHKHTCFTCCNYLRPQLWSFSCDRAGWESVECRHVLSCEQVSTFHENC